MEDTQLISLVQAAQRGDREAFGELVTEFEPTVFAMTLRRLRNRSEAREVTQEVFLRAMRKIEQLREPERFVGWLKRIAIRLSINRAVRKPREMMTSPDTFAAVSTSPDVAFDSVLEGERAHQVRGGLDRLRPLDRDTLIAFYFEGQSLKEMSAQTGSPIGTIKRRLHTARSRLREQLADLQPA
ncbi:MAG: sigma-70 family RNA polymerase sigma factor [Planctomycetaceae bacterium]|nr:sigma-70 family RNA polymerase sigma factor [Planctomycetaceae bacterium]